MLWHLQSQQQETTSIYRKNINNAVGIFKFVWETFAPILEHLRIERHHICHV